MWISQLKTVNFDPGAILKKFEFYSVPISKFQKAELFQKILSKYVRDLKFVEGKNGGF